MALLLIGLSGTALAGPSVPPETVEKAAAAVNPALVRIQVVTVEYSEGREQKELAAGSGVILTPEGYVVTNHHVAGKAKQITCTLADREEIDADLVGTDPLTDICVIKLRPDKPRRFAAARFGDSSRLKVGEPVLAMGSPLALSQSVTMGIVSNSSLVMPDVFWPFKFEVDGEDVGSIVRWIGHDARISHGNSGGPLVNLQGEVVGINEMEFGLSGAIPGNLAREVAEQLIRDGKVARSWIGLDVQPMLTSQSGSGILVGGAVPRSPAADAGFRPGDILVSLAGVNVSVRVPEELPLFNQLVAALPVGKPVEANVLRGGEAIALQVTPAARERAEPKEREFSQWGMTARNLSLIGAEELGRKTRDGVLVTSVRPGGPSSEAKPGIAERDVIVEVAGAPVRSIEDLAATTDRVTAGNTKPQPTLVAFERRTERYLTVVKLGREQASEPALEVRKAWIGLATQVLTKEMAEALGVADQTGVRVTQVYPNTSAAAAGLQLEDLIVALDGDTIPASRPEDLEVFSTMVRQRRIGADAELTVMRDRKVQKITVKLEASPQMGSEMKKYRDDNFEFTVRDVVFEDRVRNRWPESQAGVMTETVKEGGWAALGHLAGGDLVLEVDGKPTPDVDSLERVMAKAAAERPRRVVLHVLRGIHSLFVELRPKWTMPEGAASGNIYGRSPNKVTSGERLLSGIRWSSDDFRPYFFGRKSLA